MRVPEPRSLHYLEPVADYPQSFPALSSSCLVILQEGGAYVKADESGSSEMAYRLEIDERNS